MRYFGGKQRIAQKIWSVIAPSIDCYYVEPFVGGASSLCAAQGTFIRIGSDANAALITMWRALSKGWKPPHKLSEEQYLKLKKQNDPENPLTAFAAFGCSWGGKWWGGYARSNILRNYASNAANSLNKKAASLENVVWRTRDYRDLAIPKGSVIYCDPPYAGTTSYAGVDPFCWKQFWNWCRTEARYSRVFISEYNAPEDALLIKKIDTTTDVRVKSGKRERRIECLFEMRR